MSTAPATAPVVDSPASSRTRGLADVLRHLGPDTEVLAAVHVPADPGVLPATIVAYARTPDGEDRWTVHYLVHGDVEPGGSQHLHQGSYDLTRAEALAEVIRRAQLPMNAR